MIEIKKIRENPDLYRKAAENKRFKVDLEALLALDQKIKPLKQQQEELQTKRNNLSKSIGQAQGDEREKLKQQVLDIKKTIESLGLELKDLTDQFDQIMYFVPQPAADDVPVGKDDLDNKEVYRFKEPTQFSFKPKDHVELGKTLDIIDIEGGVKLAGSRSYILKGMGALLEQAVFRFTYDYLMEQSFTPLSVPVLVKDSCMEGTGYYPLGRDQAYSVAKDNLSLVGTSEVSMCSYHSDETLKESELPKKYMALSSCFRREAGTYGKDTKGLYRVHQFQKVEMVVIGKACQEDSAELHDMLSHHAEHILKALGLPYRKVYVCTGDLGQGQVRKHDLETYMPSRNGYGETHSCSTFYDFQSRRLNIRYKTQDGKKNFVYTLNNTACASPRILIALIENFQTEEGHIVIPEVLRKYMGGLERITPPE